MIGRSTALSTSFLSSLSKTDQTAFDLVDNVVAEIFKHSKDTDHQHQARMQKWQQIAGSLSLDVKDKAANLIYEFAKRTVKVKKTITEQPIERLLKISAHFGHAPSQYELGRVYSGKGDEKSNQIAFKFFEAAEKNGHQQAAYKTATHYLYGIGTKQNLERAMQLYETYACSNLSGVQFRLAWGYYHGKGVRVDKDRSFKHAKRAVLQKHVLAHRILAGLYFNGTAKIKQNYEISFFANLVSAAQGDLSSQFNIALHFEMGYGVAKDLVFALKLYQKIQEEANLMKDAEPFEAENIQESLIRAKHGVIRLKELRAAQIISEMHVFPEKYEPLSEGFPIEWIQTSKGGSPIASFKLALFFKNTGDIKRFKEYSNYASKVAHEKLFALTGF